MMKARHILFNTSWDELDIGTCKFFVEFFDEYIPFLLFQEHEPKPKLTDKMILAINQIMALHEREQGIYFGAFSKDEHSKQKKVKEIHIDQDNDTLDAVYSEVIMHTVSPAHLSLIVKDGEIVFVDRKGTYFEDVRGFRK